MEAFTANIARTPGNAINFLEGLLHLAWVPARQDLAGVRMRRDLQNVAHALQPVRVRASSSFHPGMLNQFQLSCLLSRHAPSVTISTLR